MKVIWCFAPILAAGLLGCSSVSHDSIKHQELKNAAYGVRMTISVSNNLVVADSSFPISVEIINSSTNIILYGDSWPEADFKVFLTHKSGKTYQLTPKVFRLTRNLLMCVNPGEKRTWTLHVSSDKYFESPDFIPTNKNIPPGSYILTVTRQVGIKNKYFSLESNLPKIKIE